MRPLIFFVLCMIFFVSTIAAQENELTVPELGFKFASPGTWVNSGINFAENQADLAALTDTDEATQPTGQTITITSLPFADFGAELDQAAETVMQNAGIQVSVTAESSVMGRRAVSLSGTNTQGRAIAANFWQQGEDLIVFTFGMPALNETWETTLASIEPLLAETLEVTAVQSEELALEMIAPMDWEVFTNEQSIGFFELGRDLESFQTNLPTTASTILVTVQTLETMGLTPDTTLEDIQAWMGFDPEIASIIDEGEFLVLDQPGFGFRDIDPEQGYANFTVITLSDEGTVTFYNLSTPDEEALEQGTPLFLTLLQTLKSIE